MQPRPNHLPAADRVSVLAAVILLAYTLTHYIKLPAIPVAYQLPGIFVAFPITINSVIAFLVAGLTAAGANWLFSAHPALQGRRVTRSWILPALTAWSISLPLYQLPFGVQWWIGLAVGGLMLILILIAEYIVIDPDDIRYPIAAAGLVAVAFALFLILAMALRSANVRLFLLLPALTLGVGLVSLRALNLRLHGQWAWLSAGLVALLTGQITAALHYWPLAPIPFGLALLAPAYALTSLLSNLSEGRTLRQSMLEPIMALAIILVTAWVMR